MKDTIPRRGVLAGFGAFAGLTACGGARASAEPVPAAKPSQAREPSPSPGAKPAAVQVGVGEADIDAYCSAHTVEESEVMRAIAEETRRTTEWWIMMVGPVEGALLRTLARLRSARSVLEIGTFTGYSAIAMAEGMPADGKLVTLDISDEWTSIAKRHWARSPHGKKIEVRLGPAIETLPKLRGPFDLVFIDADKASYPAYWEEVVPKVAPGGLIVLDNVLRSGQVIAPDNEGARAMAAFNAQVHADERTQEVMLAIRDGVTVAMKIS